MPGTMRRLMVLAVSTLTGAAAFSQSDTLSAEDRRDIQALVTSYASALFGCDADAFAALFVPETGYFASGFRGRMVGHDELAALVESERHCRAPAGSEESRRAGGSNAPTVEIEVANGRVLGLIDLGSAEYQDEYEETPDGWRFASRTVIIAAEKAAGLDARDLLAIQRLGGDGLGDYYVNDADGEPRLLSSGIAIAVDGDTVTGKAYLRTGGYREEVYEESPSGEWRVVSSVFVPPDSL